MFELTMYKWQTIIAESKVANLVKWGMPFYNLTTFSLGNSSILIVH